MKRFWCDICQRLRRARKYPAGTQFIEGQHPRGECEWDTRSADQQTRIAQRPVKKSSVRE